MGSYSSSWTPIFHSQCLPRHLRHSLHLNSPLPDFCKIYYTLLSILYDNAQVSSNMSVSCSGLYIDPMTVGSLLCSLVETELQCTSEWGLCNRGLASVHWNKDVAIVAGHLLLETQDPITWRFCLSCMHFYSYIGMEKCVTALKQHADSYLSPARGCNFSMPFALVQSITVILSLLPSPPLYISALRMSV